MKIKSSWGIAVKALRKNKLQTALTMTGMTIGVATVLTMIALGSGAQESIQQQVRAAGMNLIIVEGGNWSRGTASDTCQKSWARGHRVHLIAVVRVAVCVAHALLYLPVLQAEIGRAHV